MVTTSSCEMHSLASNRHFPTVCSLSESADLSTLPDLETSGQVLCHRIHAGRTDRPLLTLNGPPPAATSLFHFCKE